MYIYAFLHHAVGCFKSLFSVLIFVCACRSRWSPCMGHEALPGHTCNLPSFPSSTATSAAIATTPTPSPPAATPTAWSVASHGEPVEPAPPPSSCSPQHWQRSGHSASSNRHPRCGSPSTASNSAGHLCHPTPTTALRPRRSTAGAWDQPSSPPLSTSPPCRRCRRDSVTASLTLTLIYILVVGQFGLATGSGGITQSNVHTTSRVHQINNVHAPLPKSWSTQTQLAPYPSSSAQ